MSRAVAKATARIVAERLPKERLRKALELSRQRHESTSGQGRNASVGCYQTVPVVLSRLANASPCNHRCPSAAALSRIDSTSPITRQ